MTSSIILILPIIVICFCLWIRMLQMSSTESIWITYDLQQNQQLNQLPTQQPNQQQLRNIQHPKTNGDGWREGMDHNHHSNDLSLHENILQKLHQTICYKDSPFTTISLLSPSLQSEYYTLDEIQQNQVQQQQQQQRLRNQWLWKVRLIYLSIHAHQNPLVYKEGVERNNRKSKNQSNVDASDIITSKIANDDRNNSTANKLMKNQQKQRQSKQQHQPQQLYKKDEFEIFYKNSNSYNCKNAKFLVVQLFQNGIGANVRLAMIPAFMAGLVTGRIVLFVSNAPVGPAFLQQPWTLSSCRRRDYQCMFLPTSPCEVTLSELENGYVLTKKETRSIFRYGNPTTSATVQEQHPQQNITSSNTTDRITDKTSTSNNINIDHHRVWIMHLAFRPQRVPETLRETLYKLAKNVVLQEYSNSRHRRSAITMHSDIEHEIDNGDRDFDLFHTMLNATNAILEDDDNVTHENEETSSNASWLKYYGSGSSIFQGLLLYALRPNSLATRRINENIHAALPSDYDPSRSIGLPIRASDKCNTESECMSFQDHLDAAMEEVSSLYLQSRTLKATGTNDNRKIHDVDNSNSSSSAAFVVVTTESRSVRLEFESLIGNSSSTNNNTGGTNLSQLLSQWPLEFRFVSNTNDVTQDTGFMKKNLDGFVANTTNKNGNISSTFTADDVMISALTSLKMQLATAVAFGNCCSNFHLLLKDLLDAGCGIDKDFGGGFTFSSLSPSTVSNYKFRCLQQHINPKYRICCAWDKSERCQRKRQQQQE